MPEPGILYTIVWFIVLLTILVFVHEWGHYIVARLFGTRIETFSIGFGREIFGWTDKAKTRWKISWIPLGGYVKFYGDASVISNPEKNLEKIPKAERDVCFHFKPLWQRVLIVAAGPLINIFFAALIFAALLFSYGSREADTTIGAISENSPAEVAEFQIGDKILEIDGFKVSTFNDMVLIIVTRPDMEINFVVERDGHIFQILATPQGVEEKNIFGRTMPVGRLGITSTTTVKLEYGFFGAIEAGGKKTWGTLVLIVDGIKRLIQGNFSKEEFSGPVGIADLAGKTAALGPEAFLSLMGLLSVSLGFINLLPIPLLDGGHLLFYSIEAVKGSPISAKAQEMAAILGLAFVLTLLFVVTWNDLDLPGLG